jgi:hypothetical protein
VNIVRKKLKNPPKKYLKKNIYKKVERQVKVLIQNLAIFLSISQQVVSADITKTSAAQYLIHEY